MIPWLPSMVSVEGAWIDIVSRLYAIFVKDVKEGHPYFQNREIWWDRRLLPGEDFEEGFWHLITRKNHESQGRLLDSRRAERLPWCGPTINNCADTCVRVWDYEEGSRKIRTYLWLEDDDYVVVLEKQTKGFRSIGFLVTAFHVDGDSQRRQLRRKYESRRP